MKGLIRFLFEYFRDRLNLSIKLQDDSGVYELTISTDAELRRNLNSDLETARTVHEEARSVLDYQIKLLDDIDDKAARTVRITVLLVGAILGAASFEDATGISLTSNYIIWGIAYLIFSIALGMKTYNVSEPYLGPNPKDLKSLLHETSDEEDMLIFLVDEGFTEWISETEFLNRVNGWYLDLTQWSLVIGIVLLTMGLLNQVLTPENTGVLKPILATLNHTVFLGIPFVIIMGLTGATVGYSLYRAYYRSP